MDTKLKKKWVSALTSGEYKQGYDRLLNKKGGYCCLGVLGEVAGIEKEFLKKNHFLRKESGSFNCLILNENVQGMLADMNDHGVPFEMIAGFINENVE